MRVPLPHALAEQAELRQQIETALSALPPEYRQGCCPAEMHQRTYERDRGDLFIWIWNGEIPDQPGPEAAAKNFAGQRELFSVRCV